MAQKIMLSRPEERINRYRTYRVLMNNEAVGNISNGETIMIEMVPPGSTIECKIDWCSSNKFVLSFVDDNEVYLQVVSGMKTIWLMYFVFFIFLISSYVVPAIWKNGNEVGMLIRKASFLLPLLYLGYYFTIGRHKYLRIEESF